MPQKIRRPIEVSKTPAQWWDVLQTPKGRAQALAVVEEALWKRFSKAGRVAVREAGELALDDAMDRLFSSGVRDPIAYAVRVAGHNLGREFGEKQREDAHAKRERGKPVERMGARTSPTEDALIEAIAIKRGEETDDSEEPVKRGRKPLPRGAWTDADLRAELGRRFFRAFGRLPTDEDAARFRQPESRAKRDPAEGEADRLLRELRAAVSKVMQWTDANPSGGDLAAHRLRRFVRELPSHLDLNPASSPPDRQWLAMVCLLDARQGRCPVPFTVGRKRLDLDRGELAILSLLAGNQPVADRRRLTVAEYIRIEASAMKKAKEHAEKEQQEADRRMARPSE